MAKVRNFHEEQVQFIHELDVEMGIQPLSYAYGPVTVPVKNEKKEEEKTEMPTHKNVSKVDITDPAMGTAFDMYHNGAQVE
ncbi:MAG: hypothetical protein K6G36_01205 [Candidatus Saccharibacteria bacterium]|nr:hypothetical protein [Candidatus Saccharibacteria bacterium]